VGAGYLSFQQILQGLDLVPPTATSPLAFRDRAGNRFTFHALRGPGSAPLVPPEYQPVLLVYLLRSLPPGLRQVQRLRSDARRAVRGFRQPGVPRDGLHNGLGQRRPVFLANPAFRAYAVIDQGTFSSTVDNAMAMRTQQMQAAAQLPGAGLENILVVIGEPTGSAPSPAGPAFAPDVSVPLTSADYFARHDPVPAAVVARWKGARAAPSGSAIVWNAASFRVEQGIAPASFAAAFGSFG
jgi:hypothetical protein